MIVLLFPLPATNFRAIIANPKSLQRDQHYFMRCHMSMCFNLPIAATLLIASLQSTEHSHNAINSAISENEHEYVVNTFITNANHASQLAEFVEENLLPQIPSKVDFLDIGGGNGDVTNRLANHFDKTTVVEPDPLFALHFQKQGYITHQKNFQDAQLAQYDFVLCSHVLYYIPQADWASCLKKMHDAIRPHGKGLILMMGTSGHWHELCTSINPDYSNGDLTVRTLKELNISYKRTSLTSLLRSNNIEDVRQIVRIYSIIDCFTPQQFDALSKEEQDLIYTKIDSFIETCLRPDGYYEVYFDNDYIILQK